MSGEYFAVDEGVGRTLALLAGPSSKARATDAVAEQGGSEARVVDRGTLDLLKLAGRYDVDDQRGEAA
ncbi:hypothetical protein [Halorubellus litoreus]|uniref:Uncharacterized protein n=1 Tax=Halorubellus litoreus TaxID=755308 RepID=A0ABD5VE25_9EURY